MTRGRTAARRREPLHEVQESVEVAYASLEGTGRDPRKSPKWFKKAEMETRDLLRRLTSFQDSMGFDDRAHGRAGEGEGAAGA